jgi:multiple sugar transport system substrate-binding protein
MALAATATIATAALALAGCTSSDSSSSDGPITLEYWSFFTGSDQPVVESIIDDFNASQDEIVIDFVPTPGDVLKQTLVQSITSGDGPDFVSIDTPDLSQFIEAGALEPVDDFYDSDLLDTENLWPAVADASEYDGQRYGVPISAFTSLLFWNKDRFAEAGLDAAPTTWDEFSEIVPKLSVDENGDGTPDQWAIALPVKESVPSFQTFALNNGGGLVSDDGKTAIIDDPKTVEAIDYWSDLVVDKKASPIGLNGADADAMLVSGQASMELIGPWMVGLLEDAGINYGIAPPLEGPAGATAVGGVTNFSIPTGLDEEKKKAAYEFFAYWNSHDTQVKWAVGAGFPPNRSDITDEELAESPSSAIFGSAGVMENLSVYNAGIPNGSQITNDVWSPAIERILNNEGSAEEILTAANAEAQSILDK